MTETSITASFGSYGVVSRKHVKNKLPSVLNISVLPNQLGYVFGIKEEYWVKHPSSWPEVPFVLLDHALKLRSDFLFIPEGFSDNKKTLELDQLRMVSDHYEHDLYSVADIMDVDVANRLKLSLSDKRYWKVERSGLGGRNANSRYTRQRTHTQFAHPLALIDAQLMDLDGAVELDDVARYARTDLSPYFKSILPIHSWIKSVNPRFILEKPILESEESNYYFPWVPFSLDYDKLMLMSEDFSLYIASKIRGLVETRVMLEARNASDAGRNVSKTLRQDNRTDSFTRDLATKINVNKAGRLVKNLMMAGLHSHFVVDYTPKDFDTVDAAVMMDCLLIPLTGPARLYTSSSLRQCFNYLIKHLFSKVRGFANAPPTVNEYGKDNPSELFAWLRREAGGARATARMAGAALAYFEHFTDGEGVPADVLSNYNQLIVDRAWAITANGANLPFHVKDDTVFKSFFPNNPHDTARMNADPNIWTLFNVFVARLEDVSFSDSRGIIRDVKRLLVDLSDKGSTYIEYSYRIMSEYEKLFLYPLAYAAQAGITEHRKMPLRVESESIMSMLAVTDWKLTKIELNDTTFIEDGITDIWAIQDVFQSLADSRYAIDRFIDVYRDETGINASIKIGRSAFIEHAPKCALHDSTSHPKIWKFFSTVDTKILRDFIDAEQARGVINRSDSIRTFCDITQVHASLWHYDWQVLHRFGDVDRGTSPELRIDMFSLSSLVPEDEVRRVIRGAQHVIMSTENQLANVPGAGETYEFKFPLLEHGMSLREIAKFLRPKSLFKAFVTTVDASNSKTMAWDAMLQQLTSTHMIKGLPVGWDWFFDETFNILQRMMDQQDVTSSNVGRWFQAFARLDNISVIETPYDADAVYINAIRDKSRGRIRLGTVGPKTYLTQPFCLADFVSINKFETTPFPKLTLSETTI
jgi:hypothetical protein